MISVKFYDKQLDNGKMADAELYFNEGPLTGLKLAGFTIWKSRSGGFNVTPPSRSYVNRDGEKVNFYFLKPAIADQDLHLAMDGMRSFILGEYERHQGRQNDF